MHLDSGVAFDTSHSLSAPLLDDDTRKSPCMSSSMGSPSKSPSGSERVTYPCRFATSMRPLTAMKR